MPLGFAIALFVVAGVAQMARAGWLGASPLAAAALVSATMACLALALIGRDIPRLISRGRAALYGHRGIGWTWTRTRNLTALIPLVLILPGLGAALAVDLQAYTPTGRSLALALAVQIGLFAVPQELLFREAVLKVFGGSLAIAFFVSALASALYALPTGLAGALLAAAAGVSAMALRVAGMNIFVVAAVQGLSTVIFGRVIVAQVDERSLWAYTLAFCLGSVIAAACVLWGRRVALRAQTSLVLDAARP